MRPLKGKVSITLDSDIIQTIRDYAEKDDRSFSVMLTFPFSGLMPLSSFSFVRFTMFQYINMVLKEYISRQGRTDET